MRAMPAVNRPGPRFFGKALLGRQLHCPSNVGKTGSTPVWGNGKTRDEGCASIRELQAYGRAAKHPFKIAIVAKEVARTG